MVEEERLDEKLKEIDKVIVPPNVRQFVGENRFQR